MFISVDHARSRAARRLPRPVFDYVDGGSDDERAMRRNERAFGALCLRQRVGVDAGTPDLSTTVLGAAVTAPVLFAPCGLAGVVRPYGELSVARAAEAVGTIAAFSTFSNHTLEDIAAAAAGPKWFQLYAVGGPAGADALVERAGVAGYTGLVITLDTAIAGKRERDLRHGVRHPVRLDVPNIVRFLPPALRRPRWLAHFLATGARLAVANAVPVPRVDDEGIAQELLAAPLTWADVERIRRRWRGVLLVKGVMEPDDARRAADLGADAVIVSNHGGRQLDAAPATVEVVADVRAALAPETEVLLDGGVRRGADVVKALALGARAVLIGRPYLWGLAAGGEPGVAAVWQVLVDEIDRTMRLLGCSSLGDLTSELVWRPGERWTALGQGHGATAIAGQGVR